jgi:tetratricopeptide (TPR) repeat protein
MICLLLLAGTLAVYQDLPQHDFVNFDDMEYVTENPNVRPGLTVKGILWAFGTGYAGNWHPLTWLSHMLDIQLFGLMPGMHHLVNLLLHMANGVLLFLALKRMTGSLWRSAFVAALFAIHPLHVESVAWVSERKDVLSSFFWMLALHAYAAYAREPTARAYAWVAVLWILGLLCKPMLVTFPFVLLLLDYWPLGRLRLKRSGGEGMAAGRSEAGPNPLIEKIPLFLLAAVWSVLIYAVQKRGGLVLNLDVLPFGLRLTNALVAYASYIGKTILPHSLAVYYVHPDHIPLAQAAAAGAALAALSFMFLGPSRKRPYLAVGWLWYLGMLVPVIGLVHVGGQAMADRYTYLPIVGLFILVAWGIPDLLGEGKKRRIGLAVTASVLLSACGMQAWIQVGHWKDSVSLWKNALAATDRNFVAHNMLGAALALQGRVGEAMTQFSESLRIRPDYERSHHNLGLALAKEGRHEEALIHFGKALSATCDFPDAVYEQRGLLRLHEGNAVKAEEQFRTALQLNPLNAAVRVNLGVALEQQGREEEALREYSRAADLDPWNAPARFRMARILVGRGRLAEAEDQYGRTLRSHPHLPEAHYNWGVMLDQRGRHREAADSFRAAVRLRADYVEARNNLAVVLARQGRYREAAAHLYTVLRIRPDHEPARKNLDLCLRNLEIERGAESRHVGP